MRAQWWYTISSYTSLPSVLQAPNPQPHLPTETCPPTTPTLIDDATDQACGKSTSTLHVATASRDGH